MKITEFLIHAKLSGYAKAGGADARINSDGSKELVYSEDHYEYRDRYYGWNPFVGEEWVLVNGQTTWVMNYLGYVTGENADGGEVYRFLQQALRQVEESAPYRGPAFFQESEWEYCQHHRGDFHCFEGEEVISLRGVEVYRLVFHGGSVGVREAE